MVMRHRYNIPHFQNLNRFISLYALDIIFHEFQKCGDVEINENCRCQLRTSYGLPCSHEQAMYLYVGQPLPLDVVDAFWKKFDFSPCISSGDNLDCEAELEELNAEFNKQFGLPSTTSVRDPIAKKPTCGRPSGRKTYVPPKPKVKADGNCGFRATAVGLRLHEDELPTIRYRLLQELNMHRQQYVSMFGADVYNNVRDRLNFFNIDECAPIIKWMSMPEIGILIASHFNVILHTITNLGSQTYLPLRSSPPPWHQHDFISLGFVNNGHYVFIFLKEGYLVPTVATQWFRFKSNYATSWITPYMERINNYTELLNRTFYNVNQD
ncbi:FAR-RED impaired response 1-like protein [Tanacetum coccineum]